MTSRLLLATFALSLASVAAEAAENRLGGSASPYLRQYAGQPVHWQPWDEQALELARRENRPIFLSSGFSTCHWCHVMARESFSNPEVAAFLNAHFVNIKLDREERPDIDRIYLAFVAATTGRAGWPLSVWLTPDLQPFLGGTYFPPEAKEGQPAFLDVARAAARGWEDEREQVVAHASRIASALRAAATPPAAGEDVPLGPAAARAAFARLAGDFDPEHGGFGRGAKFPDIPKILFLFRLGASDAAEPAEAARARRLGLAALEALVHGDLHDAVDGGFHRYAEERDWSRPHYEKMLYDQALISVALLEAYQLSGDNRWAGHARTTLDFIRRELTAPEGGFYSALDAESLPEAGAPVPVEGAYYALSAEEREAARRDPATRARLRDLRAGRPAPKRDEKRVAAWNGYAISAFALAHRVLGDDEALGIAVRAAERLRHSNYDEATGRLSRIPGQHAGFAEDYAAVIQALLDLHAAGFEPRWLDWALALQETQDRLFGDDAGGGYFNTAGDDTTILVRMKEDFDDAEPSANALAAHNLRRLAVLTGDDRLAARGRRILATFAPLHTHTLAAMPVLLAAALASPDKGRQVVIAGNPSLEGTGALLREAWRRYDPFATVLLADGPSGRWLGQRLPALAAMAVGEGTPTAYMCENFVCREPVFSPADLSRLLDRN